MVVSGRPGAFTDVDIESLEAIAPYIALALRDATDWQAVDRRLRRDPLTGVANRAAVLERLNVWMAEEGVHGAVTLHFVVLDESRSTGGTPGPAAGDLRLKEVAAALNSGVRSDDLVGRLRRDEFVVVCRRIGVEDADRMGERLAELAQGIVVVSRSRPDESADELLRRADEAMCERTGVRRAPKSSSAEAGT
jgi:diguanylate cyclase (GGDEF)-like protein